MIEAKESVFVPCGHRCCCYDCAEIVKTKFNKCSLCSSNILYVLKKVYD